MLMFDVLPQDQPDARWNRHLMNRCRRMCRVNGYVAISWNRNWDRAFRKQQGLAVETIKLKLPLVDNSRWLRIAGNPSKLSILHWKINSTTKESRRKSILSCDIFEMLRRRLGTLGPFIIGEEDKPHSPQSISNMVTKKAIAKVVCGKPGRAR